MIITNVANTISNSPLLFLYIFLKNTKIDLCHIKNDFQENADLKITTCGTVIFQNFEE